MDRAKLRFLSWMIFLMSGEAGGTPCTITNWPYRKQFGPECRYLCRCEDKITQCDQSSGECPGKCQSSWMGPACQYRNLAYQKRVTFAGNNRALALDGNLNSCTLAISSIQIELEEIYPVSRLKIVFKKTGVSFKVLLKYGIQDAGQHCFTSYGSQTKTVQIICEEMFYSAYVMVDIIDGETAEICDIEVNGGRNVALLQETKQSSTQYKGVSSRAVDGGTNNGIYAYNGGHDDGTCIHTVDYGSEYSGTVDPWWRVDLQNVYNIWWFSIVNNNEPRPAPNRPSRKARLNGFEMSVANQSFDLNPTTMKLYTETRNLENENYKLTFTNIPQVAAQYMEIKVPGSPKILQICEVKIYGDCPGGKCGLRCDMVCWCNASQYYNVLTGECPHGCEPGWKLAPNNTCSEECDDFTYGEGCDKTCYNCYASGVCNKVTGACPNNDCKAGWTGQDCNTACPGRKYGRNCLKTCGACRDNQLCDIESGECPGGLCSAGYRGSHCNETCPPTTFGQNCENVCGQCRSPETCEIYEGICLSFLCESGWKGNKCDIPCPDNKHGYNCSQSCLNCHNGVACNKETGACPGGQCAPGWNGTSCSLVCENGTYGSNCREFCGNCLTQPCDVATGSCSSGDCENGWTGHDCKTESSNADFQSGNDDSGSNTGAVIGGVFAAVVISILIIVAVILILRRRRIGARKDARTASVGESHNTLNGHHNPVFKTEDKYVYENSMNILSASESAQESATKEHGTTGTLQLPSEDSGDTYYNINSDDRSRKGGILLNDLWDYVQENCINTKHLEEEFSELPVGLQLATDEATKPENSKKNRYKKIYPYDHCRVVLNPVIGNKSDYINASFIQGYGDSKRYIAAQGTTTNNINDFCRMLWQQDCGKLVMLTNLIENGTMKCLQYWPDEGEVKFGRITVANQQTEVFADYTIRQLVLKSDDESGSKLVKQFHYTAWPDKDVPGIASSIVQFWNKVKSTPTTRKGPVVVHCSAGIGRTGTFIALDYLVEQGQAVGKVNVFNCVKTLRDQRVNMVQTKEQYVFLHEALVEALMLSGTSTTSDKFPAVYSELQKLDERNGKTKLLLEFERLQEESLGRKAKRMIASQSAGINGEDVYNEDEFKSARQPENLPKNRFSDILPPDLYRPYLISKGESDYINAVYLPSHRNRNGYIITQTPLPCTVVDFWRLVHDKQLNLVVMIDELDSTYTNASVGKYWPEENPLLVGDFQLERTSEIKGDYFITCDIQLTNSKTGDILKVRQFQCTFWPESASVPSDPSPIFNLFEAVQDWQRQTTEDQPVLVHCLNGADRSGLYCVLATVIERLNIERDVAVSQTIKKMRVRRQQIIPSFDQFQFCYDAVLQYLKTFDTYSNFA